MTSRALLLGVATLLLVAVLVLLAGRGEKSAPPPATTPARPTPAIAPVPATDTAAPTPSKALAHPGFAGEVLAALQSAPGTPPEIALLDQNDWNAIDQYGKDANFPPGERVARAAKFAKHEASAKAIRSILRAARESAPSGKAPASLADLAGQVGAEILARYELIPKGAWPPETAKEVDAAIRAYQMTGRPAQEVDAIVIEKSPDSHAPAFGFMYGENFFTSGYVDSPEP